MINCPAHFTKYPSYKEGKKLIIRLDPSSLNNANCDQYFEFNNLEGKIKKRPRVDAEYGQAVHIAAADLQRGINSRLCEVKGMTYFLNSNCNTEGEWRNEGHLMKTLSVYCRKYEKDITFKPKTITREDGSIDFGVELPFALPLIATEFCEVILCGVIDSIGTYMDTWQCFKDIKTTGSYSAKKFVESYRRSVQFKIYSYALKTMGWCNHFPPVLIDLVFLKSEPPFVELSRSQLIDFTPEEIDNTMSWVRHKAKLLCNAIETNTFYKNGTCCNLWDGCLYQGICWGTDTMKAFESQKFVQRLYDPTKFGEKPTLWKPIS